MIMFQTRTDARRVVVEIPKLLDRSPPMSIETEKALLGSLILAPEYMADVTSVIREPEAFYEPAHRAIYAVMCRMIEKKGTLDVTLLGNQLHDCVELDVHGGLDYLMTLANAAGVPAMAPHYASVVAEKHQLRQVITAAGEMLHDVYTHSEASGEDAKAVVDRTEQRVFSIAEKYVTTDAVPLSRAVMEEYQRIMDLEGKPPAGTMTGFHKLDEMLGGFQPGELIILGARPSMGKTALALNIAEQIAFGSDMPYTTRPATNRRPTPIGIFSLEMSKASLVQRMLSGWSKIEQTRIRRGELSQADYQTLLDVAKDLALAPLHIDDTPSGMSMTSLRSKARRMVARHGCKVLMIDYLQLLSSPGHRQQNRQEEVGSISRGLKSLARELGVPILALCQLNRNAENRDGNKPMMSDLRESGSLEQDADVILLLHREAYYHKGDPAWDPSSPEFDPANTERVNAAEIIVAKQRNGPTGAVKLVFASDETRFKNAGSTSASLLMTSRRPAMPQTQTVSTQGIVPRPADIDDDTPF